MAGNKRIKDFSLEGEIANDSFIFGHREKMEKLMDSHMRNLGYVPHLDLDSQYSISYNLERETFDFHITVYGVYVGKKRAHEIVGKSGSSFIKK